MEHLIASYTANPEALPLVALTPTNYRVGQRSIYAPVRVAGSPT
jgi:hypothetical protein